jgi:hypothetical protein
MTIEEALARSALNLGRIADALEALVNSQGIVPGTKSARKKKKPKSRSPSRTMFDQC